MGNEDKVYAITSGTLDLNFNTVPFDNKKDFNNVKSLIKMSARKIIDEYNGSGSDLEFEDSTEGEYLE